MYVRVVGVIFRWCGGRCSVSHDVQGMLGFCELRTVGNKVVLSIVLCSTVLFKRLRNFCQCCAHCNCTVSIPASPAHHGKRNTITYTSGRSHLPRVSTWPLLTLRTLPIITHKQLTTLYIFMPHRLNKILHASEHTPTSQ
jgi:hypothetical protein